MVEKLAPVVEVELGSSGVNLPTAPEQGPPFVMSFRQTGRDASLTGVRLAKPNQALPAAALAVSGSERRTAQATCIRHLPSEPLPFSAHFWLLSHLPGNSYAILCRRVHMQAKPYKPTLNSSHTGTRTRGRLGWLLLKDRDCGQSSSSPTPITKSSGLRVPRGRGASGFGDDKETRSTWLGPTSAQTTCFEATGERALFGTRKRIGLM